MTREEISIKSQEKVAAIKTLCDKLELVPSSKQRIDQQGFIEMIVVFTDTEKYDIDPKNAIDQIDPGKAVAEAVAPVGSAAQAGEAGENGTVDDNKPNQEKNGPTIDKPKTTEEETPENS